MMIEEAKGPTTLPHLQDTASVLSPKGVNNKSGVVSNAQPAPTFLSRQQMNPGFKSMPNVHPDDAIASGGANFDSHSKSSAGDDK